MNESEENNQMLPPQDQDSFPPVSRPDLTEAIGTQIGPYKLLSFLGEGGFGIVYLAEQKKPVRRQVALKVIKPGMDSKQIIARFEAEQQALALLDHPNIARVFDAGTTEKGRLYFAMEYVKGRSVTEYCDHEKLAIEERLRLFIRICEAVQHAHQKGIIHRDIKPSNILVSVQGGQSIPKIIDFGVAKALSQPLTERTLFTEQGQLIGTPEYMSPEQAEIIAQNVDTRSDVYSLGVVLYELLSGTLPFDPKTLRQAAFGEIQRIIREEEPPRPSTRISILGDSATRVAQNRRMDVKRLVRRLHSELEWIPLMAMRKEPDRRYGTASSLAHDIQNYLNGNPLLAGPESTIYRVRKFTRRNRALVTGIAAVLVVLVAGAAVSTGLAFWALRERALAERQRVLAEKQRALAEQRAADATAGLLPMDILAGILRRQGQYDEAEQLYETVRDISKRLFTNEHPTAVLSMGCLASFYCDRNRYEEAEALFDELIPLSKCVFGVEDPNTLNYMGFLANLYRHQDRYNEAEALYGEIMKISEDAFHMEHPDILVHMHNFATFFRDQGRYDKAEPLYRKVVELSESVLPREQRHKWIYMENLATLYVEQEQCDEADRLYVRVWEAMCSARGQNHAETQQYAKRVIKGYEAWNKPEKAKEWRTKLSQIEDFEE